MEQTGVGELSLISLKIPQLAHVVVMLLIPYSSALMVHVRIVPVQNLVHLVRERRVKCMW